MSDESTQPVRRKPWFLTICGVLVTVSLAALPWIAGKPGDKELPDWVRFVGHFHPVILHLPIGVFLLIFFQELGRLLRFKRPGADGDSLFPLFFGVVSAVLAVLAGFMLYHGHAEDYAGEELAERHLWSGLAFAVLSVVTFVAKAWAMSCGSRGWGYRFLLFGSVGVMAFASHDGGSMTHGSDFLTRYAPDPVRKVLGLEPVEEKPVAPADPVVYADIIHPIFERRCVQCHKPGKTKGKLRMDTYELLVKGGSEGPAITAGNSAESLVIQRIELPEDDDEHMPPEGKPDIEPNELAVLKWWIDSGADPKKKLSELTVPDQLKEALAGVSKIAPKAAGGDQPAGHGTPAAKGPDETLTKMVASLTTEFPGAVSFESRDSANVTITAASLRGKMGDAEFVKLLPLLPHVVSLDLSATKVTDEVVRKLSSAAGLRRLRLSETPVTDASLEVLATLPALESLNLYGTAVTDEGVSKLKSTKSLKHLYLWQTSVTPAAVEALKAALPGCEVITGAAVSK